MASLFKSIMNFIGMGKFILVVVVLAALGGGGWYIYTYNPFNWDLSFVTGQMEIDKTKNVVEQVKKISEFTTMCYYEESVVKDAREVKGESAVRDFLHIKQSIKHEELVFIAKGKVRAGFNLSKITEEDLTVKSDTLLVQLPAPEIFDVIVNPSDFEVYLEEGKWSHQDVTNIQTKHKENLKKIAIEKGIFEKAISSGKNKLTSFFTTFGFNVVELSVKEN